MKLLLMNNFLFQAQALPGLQVEAIFGGAVLLFVLSMLVIGKLRLDREILSKDEVIDIYDRIIDEQRDTIKQLTKRDEITHVLLKEIRDLAMKAEGARQHVQERAGGD